MYTVRANIVAAATSSLENLLFSSFPLSAYVCYTEIFFFPKSKKRATSVLERIMLLINLLWILGPITHLRKYNKQQHISHMLLLIKMCNSRYKMMLKYNMNQIGIKDGILSDKTIYLFGVHIGWCINILPRWHRRWLRRWINHTNAFGICGPYINLERSAITVRIFFLIFPMQRRAMLLVSVFLSQVKNVLN